MRVFVESEGVQCKALLLELYRLALSISALQVSRKEANDKRRLDLLVKILILRIDLQVNSAEDKFIQGRLKNFHKIYTEQKISSIPFGNDAVLQHELFSVAQIFLSHGFSQLFAEPGGLRNIDVELFSVLAKCDNDVFIQLLSIYCELVFKLKTMNKIIQQPLGQQVLAQAWLGFKLTNQDDEAGMERCYKHLESDYKKSQPGNVAVRLKFAVASICFYRWQQAKAYFMVNQKKPNTTSLAVTEAHGSGYSFPVPRLSIDEEANLPLVVELVKINNKLTASCHYLEAVQLLASLDVTKLMHDYDNFLKYFAITKSDGLYCADEGMTFSDRFDLKRKDVSALSRKDQEECVKFLTTLTSATGSFKIAMTAMDTATKGRVIDFQGVSREPNVNNEKPKEKTAFSKPSLGMQGLQNLVTQFSPSYVLLTGLSPEKSFPGEIAIVEDIRDMEASVEIAQVTIESIETKWREIEAESNRFSDELANFEDKRKTRKAKKAKPEPTRDEAPKPPVAKNAKDSDSEESSDEDKCETILSEIKTDAETLLEFYDSKSFEYAQQISQQYKDIVKIIKRSDRPGHWLDEKSRLELPVAIERICDQHVALLDFVMRYHQLEKETRGHNKELSERVRPSLSSIDSFVRNIESLKTNVCELLIEKGKFTNRGSSFWQACADIFASRLKKVTTEAESPVGPIPIVGQVALPESLQEMFAAYRALPHLQLTGGLAKTIIEDMLEGGKNSAKDNFKDKILDMDFTTSSDNPGDLMTIDNRFKTSKYVNRVCRRKGKNYSVDILFANKQRQYTPDSRDAFLRDDYVSRHFTAWSLYIDGDGKVRDPSRKGMQDIKNKRLRTVDEDTVGMLDSDPICVLIAMKKMLEGYTPDEKLESALRRINLADKVVATHWHYMVCKHLETLKLEQRLQYIDLLRDYGLLERAFHLTFKTTEKTLDELMQLVNFHPSKKPGLFNTSQPPRTSPNISNSAVLSPGF